MSFYKNFFLILICICFILIIVWLAFTLNYESSIHEGDGFVTFVYEYNLPLWRIEVHGQASDFDGTFWASRDFNISVGWWHFMIKGDIIIHAEKKEIS